MMKVQELINGLNKALNSNTIYASGMWGQIIDDNIILSKQRQYPSKYTEEKVKKLKSLIGKNYFGFDCVCLIKAILWGWTGRLDHPSGGAIYTSNEVPDFGTSIINHCKEVSTDFSKIIPGALVWREGHVGIYIGNKEVIECTSSWTYNVVKSSLANIGGVGSYRRSWTKWGKLPYIDYSDNKPSKEPSTTTTFKNGDIVRLNKGAKTTQGVRLASFVYDRDHILTKISKNEGTITYQNTVVARIFLKDLTLIKSTNSNLQTSSAPQVVEGSTVRLNKGAKTTDGRALASFVYNRNHTATKIKNGECTIKYNGITVARVFIKDLTVV